MGGRAVDGYEGFDGVEEGCSWCCLVGGCAGREEGEEDVGEDLGLELDWEGGVGCGGGGHCCVFFGFGDCGPSS